MKTKLVIALFVGFTTLSQAAVTLSFSTTSVYASNFLNGSGSSDGAAARMVWGVVVDVAGNGFGGASATSAYRGGFNLASTPGGVVMTTTTDGLDSVASDDVLFIAGSVMAQNSNANDGSAIGMNRLLSFSNLAYGTGGVAQGQSFAIIWFDALALTGTADTGLKYGVYEMTSLNTLPADPGTYALSPAFTGADAPKAMEYAINVVPEPSAALLGAIGVLGLLRRRRI